MLVITGSVPMAGRFASFCVAMDQLPLEKSRQVRPASGQSGAAHGAAKAGGGQRSRGISKVVVPSDRSPSVIRAGYLVSSVTWQWKIPELNGGFERNITYFYGQFSGTPRLITRGHLPGWFF